MTPDASRPRILPAILRGGLTAGALDIADPIIFYGVQGVAPVRILQSVASRLLGRAAFEAGWPTPPCMSQRA